MNTLHDATYTCQTVSVSVPATSANLGPGFDTLGLALDYRDHATFTLLNSQNPADVQVIIEGEGAQSLPTDASHLVIRAFYQACDALGLPKRAVRLEAHNTIPQSRGLGSSAEAIVTGVTAAAAFAGLTGEQAKDFIFELAARIEGHPDNVAPAVYGALTASWVTGDASEQHYHTVRYPVRAAIHAWVIIPDYQLSTKAAREALPHDVPRADALLNVSRATLLPAALVDGIAYTSTIGAGISTTGAKPTGACDSPAAQQQSETTNIEGGQAETASVDDGQAGIVQTNAVQAHRSQTTAVQTNAAQTALPGQDLLLAATEDTLHQRYRSSLMQPSWDVMQALRQAGFASTISGAGPCVLVLFNSTDNAEITDGAEIADNAVIAVDTNSSVDAQVDEADRRIRAIIEPWLHNSEWRVIHPAIDEHGVMWQCTKEA
ncbi:homoserine kinase [Galliscardovia ingluviei]|uniref:Homoserine kinase n=1 Tax=Galliscardovia ingluviei TaxID=1769422 RepID=A0A8J3API2_9BIFI|nr:homoserine kinase [Galliscardovia ingluviei]GGI14441.1 homoserine kinase [Galliscardovia ingluviei]